MVDVEDKSVADHADEGDEGHQNEVVHAPPAPELSTGPGGHTHVARHVACHVAGIGKVAFVREVNHVADIVHDHSGCWC